MGSTALSLLLTWTRCVLMHNMTNEFLLVLELFVNGKLVLIKIQSKHWDYRTVGKWGVVQSLRRSWVALCTHSPCCWLTGERTPLMHLMSLMYV